MLTLTGFVIKSTAARICTGATTGQRVAIIINDGLCPLWVGTADVLITHGWLLQPGDEYRHTESDELYAIGRGNPAGSVTVDESRSQ